MGFFVDLDTLIDPTVFVKIAGISGAVAMGMSAYSARAFKPKNPESVKKLEGAILQHHLHNLALLSVPLMNRPQLVGLLLTSGVTMLSGSLYLEALSEGEMRGFPPAGGITLMMAWLAMGFLE